MTLFDVFRDPARSAAYTRPEFSGTYSLVAGDLPAIIADEMVRAARSLDPTGDSRWIDAGRLRRYPRRAYDLVLSAFAFDNMPTYRVADRRRAHDRRPSRRPRALHPRRLPRDLRPRGGVLLDEGRHRLFRGGLPPDLRAAKLGLLETARPIGRPEDGREWISETQIPPWAIYVLGRVP